MSRDLEEVLLGPGDPVRFEDRDDLLEKLHDLNRRVPGRSEGATKDHREHRCIVSYLRFLAGEGLLDLPVTMTRTPEGQDPPDFVLEWPDGRRETFELTEGCTEKYQQALTEAARRGDEEIVLPEGADIQMPDEDAAALWSHVVFESYRNKAENLVRGRFDLDHLLIYDLTGPSELVPFAAGEPKLRKRIEQWHASRQPQHRFGRVSVLRDLALLDDLTGRSRVLSAESPYFRLWKIEAGDEDDLNWRLREIDRYCRVHSIRHLELSDSVLGDLGEVADGSGESHRFSADSDLDLLVEFEPGTEVTVPDMARMERELGELLGFRVDLRTAEDSSRCFRQEVVEEAVESRGRTL